MIPFPFLPCGLKTLYHSRARFSTARQAIGEYVKARHAHLPQGGDAFLHVPFRIVAGDARHTHQHALRAQRFKRQTQVEKRAGVVPAGVGAVDGRIYVCLLYTSRCV